MAAVNCIIARCANEALPSLEECNKAKRFQQLQLVNNRRTFSQRAVLISKASESSELERLNCAPHVDMCMSTTLLGRTPCFAFFDVLSVCGPAFFFIL